MLKVSYLTNNFIISLAFSLFVSFLEIPDYQSYKEIYELHTPKLLDYLFNGMTFYPRTELFFNLVSSFFKQLFFPFELFRFFILFAAIYLKLYVFHHITSFFSIAVIAYLALFSYNDAMWLRQSLASGIIALGILYIIESKKKFIMITITASLFHSSSLVALLLLFYKNLISKKAFIVLMVVGIVVSGSGIGRIAVNTIANLMSSTYVGSALNSYSQAIESEDLSSGIFRGSIILSLIVLFIAVLYRKRLSTINHKAELIIATGLCSLLFLIIFNDIGSLLADRTYRRLGFAFPIMIALIISLLPKHTKFLSKTFANILFIALSFFLIPTDRTELLINFN